MSRGCDKKDMTVKVFLRETDREEKFRLLDHIFSCAECLTEFNVLIEIWRKESSLGDMELEQIIEQVGITPIESIAKKELKTLKQEARKRKHTLFSPRNIAAAAAVLIAVLVSIYIAKLTRPELMPLEREVGSQIFRTIEPEGAIDNSPILFQWNPVKGAREYTIEVLDDGLEMIYRKERILVPSFALPDKIYSQLQVSRTYFWKVIATLDSEKSIESEFGKFYLTGR